MRGQLSGLLRATKPEAAIVPPVTVNVRVDRVVDEVSRGEMVPQAPTVLDSEAILMPKARSTYTVSLEPLEPGVPDIPSKALTLSGAGSRAGPLVREGPPARTELHPDPNKVGAPQFGSYGTPLEKGVPVNFA